MSRGAPPRWTSRDSASGLSLHKSSKALFFMRMAHSGVRFAHLQLFWYLASR
jgi:hypothetical protein